MATFSGSTSELMEKLLRQNERHINRLISFVMAVSGLLFICLSLLDLFGIYNLGHPLCRWLTLSVGVIGEALFFFARRLRYSSSYLKNVLIAYMLFASGFLFFFYPLNCGSVIHYLPVIVSSLYLNKKVIKGTAAVNWVLYTILVWASVYLENNSEFFHQLNAFQGIAQAWRYPMDVFLYHYLPHTFFFIITTRVCLDINKNGSRMLSKQALFATDITKVETELEMASHIQLSSLQPAEYETPTGNMRIDAFMHPARLVAGDFYDYFLAGSRLNIMVGDVSDKGLSAAMYMMKTKGVIRANVRTNPDLTSALTRANMLLCSDNQENMFVTLWIASIDIRTGWGRYINCGHLPPLIKHGDGTLSAVENTPDLMLGILEDAQPTAHPIHLAPSDSLFIFTDGLTDAANTEGQTFGKQRLLDTVAKIPGGTKEFCSRILNEISTFTQGTTQFDDMTALSISVNSLPEPSKDSFTLPAVPGSEEEVLNRINVLLEENSCPQDIRRNIDVALDDVCVNIIDYAYPDGKGDFSVTAAAGANYFEVTVVDHGIPFDPLKAKEPDLDDFSRIGGLGIFLAKNIMDEMKYFRCENENRLYLLKLWNS